MLCTACLRKAGEKTAVGISEAEKICSRVAIIYKGKLLRIVKIAEIKSGSLENIFIDEINRAENL